MKKLFLVVLSLSLFLTHSGVSSAQAKGGYEYKCGKILVDGVKIGEENYAACMSVENFNKYMSARKMYNAGVGLTVAGGVLCAFGAGMVIYHHAVAVPSSNPLTGPVPLHGAIGYTAIGVSVPFLGSGITLMSIGSKRMKGMCAILEASTGGLALKF
jgi:hypothetical protein